MPFFETLPLQDNVFLLTKIFKGRTKLCLPDPTDVLGSKRGDAIVEDQESRRRNFLHYVLQKYFLPLCLKYGVENDLWSGGVLLVEVFPDVSRVGDDLLRRGIEDHRDGVPRSSIQRDLGEKWVTGG